LIDVLRYSPAKLENFSVRFGDPRGYRSVLLTGYTLGRIGNLFLSEENRMNLIKQGVRFYFSRAAGESGDLEFEVWAH